jgi:hypothetical protein
MGVVNDAVEDGVGQGRIAEYHVMPWILSGESLRSGWLIPVTRFLAAACRSVIACPVVALV